ncbi:MAG: ABC transporter substrate-binding protein, partial [Actinomycetes bacterium]
PRVLRFLHSRLDRLGQPLRDEGDTAFRTTEHDIASGGELMDHMHFAKGAARRATGAGLSLACLATLVLVALVSSAPVALASGPSASPSSGGKVVLRVGTLQDIDSLNPFAGVTVAAYEMFHLNYDMLTGYAPDGSVRPEIADSWTTSPDGLTWTFKIHPGMKWQDGQPVTANDVAFTYNYIIENKLSAYTSSTVNIKNAEAVDDSTVVFHLTKPKATMLRLWIPIVPEHIWGNIPGSKAGTFNSKPPVIGSGPFQVIEVKKGSYIRFAANKDYWKGAPKVDEVILEIYTNQDTMAMDLKSGAIDVAVDLPAAQFKAMANEPGITATTLTGHGLKTGDFGRVDESGAVWIAGRKDDIIKRGGEKVSIVHVQQALQALGRFADVAVLAAPDEILGHVPVAFVVPLEMYGFKPSRLLRELRGVLPSSSLPSRVIAVKAVPRTGSGKAIRAELQAILDEELA